MPEGLPRRLEVVDKVISLLAHVADTVFARQARRVQNNSGAAVVILLLRDVVQENSLQSLKLKVHAPTRHGKFALRIVRVEGVNELSISKVAHVEGNFLAARLIPIERNQINIVSRLVSEDIMTATNHAGKSYNVALARQGK